MVEKPIDAALWPRTRKGVVLYALAAVAAIILGIIPALWINRWRASEAAAEPAPEQPIVAEPAPVAEPSAEPAAAVETEATIEMEPDEVAPAETERAVTVKTTKRARPRPRAKPATKKAAPTCDIYLYPHGCPK
ncbi:MAG: hypothetical protein HOV81_07370 [Kofleriaceae bacterium]|nr:hypothetical protein [Kofleriaceae bacterium]